MNDNYTIEVCPICDVEYVDEQPSCDHNTITINCTQEEYKKLQNKEKIRNKLK